MTLVIRAGQPGRVRSVFLDLIDARAAVLNLPEAIKSRPVSGRTRHG